MTMTRSAWGAEEIFDPGVGDLTFADPGEPFAGRVLPAAIWLTEGFGASANRFLHDITITADGTQAYLANWDAGLVLLDISDPADPQVVSVALDLVNGSLDGEVNSHSVWPSEDGAIVVGRRGRLQCLGGDSAAGQSDAAGPQHDSGRRNFK